MLYSAMKAPSEMLHLTAVKMKKAKSRPIEVSNLNFSETFFLENLNSSLWLIFTGFLR